MTYDEFSLSPQSGRYGAPLKREQARRCVVFFFVVGDFESLLYSSNTLRRAVIREEKRFGPEFFPNNG